MEVYIKQNRYWKIVLKRNIFKKKKVYIIFFVTMLLMRSGAFPPIHFFYPQIFLKNEITKLAL